jgi:YVTN family beta-propeller protein
VAVIDADDLRLLATIPAELGAGGVAVDTRRQVAYCANFLTASLTVIDCRSQKPIGRIEVGRAPCSAIVNSANDSLYLANSASNSVTRVDLRSGTVRGELPVGRGPVGICTSLSGDRIYTGNRGEGTVSVIGAHDDCEWARIPVGEAPAGCAVDPRNGHLLVSNAGSATVTVLEDLLRGPAPGDGMPQHPLVGQKLPAFRLPDLRTGRVRHSREWSERKYILNFFASW